MTASFLVGMMITLVAFVLISGVLMRFMAEADDVAAENLCYDSIALRAMTAFQLDLAGVDIEGKLIPPLCQTIDKKVSGTKDQVIKEVADSMARCWWMFGAGEYEEILHDTDVDVIYNTDNTENKCFNCYNLLMDVDDFDGEEYILAEEIQDYMLNNTYSTSNMTYVDYIQSYGGPGRMLITAPAIVPTEGYSVSLMPKLKNSDASFWEGGAEVYVGIGIIVLAVGGAVCVLGTGGACLAVLLPAGAAATVGTASATTVVGTAVVIGGAGAYTAYDGYNEMVSSLVDEDSRDVSSVFLSFQSVGEEMCPDGDLAGE